MMDAARDAWDQTLSIGKEYGYRNGQATVLAPTGTIGFMMDCDTTGIEPDIALIKYKRLVGGGMIKIVNNTVTEALAKLGYDDEQAKAIVDYIDTEETIEGAPGLKAEHLPVFDCAFRAANGTRSIHYHGSHPHDGGGAAVHLGRDLEDGQPAARVHRRGRAGRVHGVVEAGAQGGRGLPRRLQADPAAVDQQDRSGAGQVATRRRSRRRRSSGPPAAVRKKLPDERQSLTHKFSIAGHEGYIHVGLYETGEPGEIFVKMAKEGSTISGLMDSFATAISLALQHGVPLRLLCDKFSRTRFEPYGFTENPEIPRASSIMDYLFRYLASKFVKQDAPVIEAARRPPPPTRSSASARWSPPPRRSRRSTSSTATGAPPRATATPTATRTATAARTPATATTASSPAPTRRPAPNADRS